MAMEENLVTRLAADTAIDALIAKDGSSNPAISWFGFQRGDGYPAIALTQITPGEDWTHTGPDGLDRPRVRADIRATSADTAIALARAVISEMQTTPYVDTGTTRFHPAMLDAERHIDLGEQDGGQVLFQIQLEFLFFHQELV